MEDFRFACVNVEDLSMMWEKLSLLEGEGNEYNVRAIEHIGGKVIAENFFTQRVLNMEAIT